MIGIQIWSGVGVEWIVPLAFLVLVSGFVSLQVKAARMHTSVELTSEWLREGEQTISVDEILQVYPEPANSGRRPLRRPTVEGQQRVDQPSAAPSGH